MARWLRRIFSLILAALVVGAAVGMGMVISFAFHGLDGRAVGAAASRLELIAYAGDGLLALVFCYLFLKWGWKSRDKTEDQKFTART